MYLDLTYKEAKANIDHLRALGITEVYLRDKSDFPWSKATRYESGGSCRLDINTSGRFYAEEDGITYIWSVELEDRSANGKSHFEIDVENVRSIICEIDGDARIQYREYLASCSEKVRERGNEFQDHADRQFKEAAILRDLARTE